MTETGKDTITKSEYIVPANMRRRKCLKLEIKSEEEEECTSFPKLGINPLPKKKIKSEKEEECTNFPKLEINQLPKNEVKQEINEDEDEEDCDSTSSLGAEDDTPFTFNGGEEIIDGKYSLMLKRDEGTFANNLECYDLDKPSMCTVKIFHGSQKCWDKALREIKILNLLAEVDPTGKYFVKMLDWSKYGNHVYIVLNHYGCSLVEHLNLVNRSMYANFNIAGLSEIGREILEAVALMHDQHLIHADLNLDHIVFSSFRTRFVKILYKGKKERHKLVPSPFSVRVIGLCSTEICEEEDVEFRDDIISSRPYRAPEVILGLGWSYPCDIWSVGCILCELLTRYQLFGRTNDDDFQHLALMELRMGKFPSHMLEKSTRAVGEGFEKGRLKLPEDMTKEFRGLRPIRLSFFFLLSLPPCNLRICLVLNLLQEFSNVSADYLDLLQGLLKLDPSERLTARGALEHPFFSRKEDD